MQQTAIANPTDAQALEAVRNALDTGVPLCDYGRAHQGLGHPCPEPHTNFSLDSHGVLEHYVTDFTVRVSAGCTMAELQQTLAAQNQFLAIDADDDLTISEVITHNVYGPMRVGYGSIRDQLLGLSFVSGEGKLIKVGGRTVKNVAGYDVTRFMVGSFGEMGVLTEATLKTAAIPDAAMTVDLKVSDPQVLDRIQTNWLTIDAAPASAILSLEQGRLILRVGYFGSSVGCEIQFRSLKSLIADYPELHIAGHQQAHAFDQYLALHAAHRAWCRQADALVKVVVPPATTGFVTHALGSHIEGNPKLMLQAYPFHGCIFVGGDLAEEQAVRLDQQITHIIQPVEGLSVWYNRPTLDIPPFSEQPDMAMLRKLKQTFDPKGIFNPGRLIQASTT